MLSLQSQIEKDCQFVTKCLTDNPIVDDIILNMQREVILLKLVRAFYKKYNIKFEKLHRIDKVSIFTRMLYLNSQLIKDYKIFSSSYKNLLNIYNIKYLRGEYSLYKLYDEYSPPYKLYK